MQGIQRSRVVNMHYQIVLSFVLVSFHCVTKENPFLFLGGKALRSLIVGSFSRDHIAVLQYEGIGHEKKINFHEEY